jgi:hypothetical protein
MENPMKPTSHKGAGAIGVPARHPSAAVNPATLAEDAYRYSRHVSQTSADSVCAFVAFTANQAITRQIEVAFDFGKFTRAQATELAATGERVFPAGPLRDAVSLAAHMQLNAADTVTALATQWGRQYGHIAFAFPVTRRTE